LITDILQCFLWAVIPAGFTQFTSNRLSWSRLEWHFSLWHRWPWHWSRGEHQFSVRSFRQWWWW